jgi:hypothetical protein
MAIIQSEIFNASSTLRGNLEETNEQCSQNVANRERVITPLSMLPNIVSTEWSH